MLEGKGTKGSEEFEDTKEVIRRLKSKDRAIQCRKEKEQRDQKSLKIPKG
jgi:hypothetical protein